MRLLGREKSAVAGGGAEETSSRHPSATACLMLSVSRGQDRARAGSPPVARISEKVAHRRTASEDHCTEVCSALSFFTWTATWQNRQSTDTKPEVR
ncbi:Uncharacterised protein [Mycolicibacterium fortuitum]|uniref:Uncharacterized protein n=1 Tax=Mycolicibacterium fortuitum TaxID=1766 RepID=A0A378V1T5_MYCFO|nr:Uncharacterised protein [Mycolicibacterium fortuitum]